MRFAIIRKGREACSQASDFFVLNGGFGTSLPTLSFRSMICAFTCAAACLICYAQEEVQEIPEEQKLLFSVMGYGDDLFEDIKFVDVYEQRMTLEFRPDRRSKVYVHPIIGKRIRFFREEIDEEGRQIDVEIAVANVSEIERRALILFLDTPDRPSGLPYTVFVADESDEAFNGGDFRFLNLSGAPLYWRAGTESAVIHMGFSPVVSYDPSDRSAFPIALAARVKDDWEIVFSTRSQSHPSLGTLFIIKPPLDPNSLRIRVHANRNRLRPEGS